MVMVTGSGPQSNVMTPPRATALTTAAEVQLAGVPSPIVRSGLLVSTARASAGTLAPPDELPGLGRLLATFRVAEADGFTAGADVAAPDAAGAAAEAAPGTAEAPPGVPEAPEAPEAPDEPDEPDAAEIGAGSAAAVLSAWSPQPLSIAAPVRAAVRIASRRLSTGRL
ncbi:hypothetical protein [Actinoplanes sp. NPDC048796]|uniref:hypothetical protein n=1 Tax=unclassified Actinoplanes TaxID=2626549 RepID=UPI0033EFB144